MSEAIQALKRVWDDLKSAEGWYREQHKKRAAQHSDEAEMHQHTFIAYRDCAGRVQTEITTLLRAAHGWSPPLACIESEQSPEACGGRLHISGTKNQIGAPYKCANRCCGEHHGDFIDHREAP